MTPRKDDRNGDLVVFEAKDGTIRLDVRLEAESVWLSLNQIAQLFDRDKSVISRHLANVFRSGELEREATVAKSATVQTEGGRQVERAVEYFNLDAILSVGYRVNSKRGTQFRIWATGVLSEHLLRGYTIHRERFERNAKELETALALVRKTAGSAALSSEQGRGLVDVIARYTQTFLLLQRYDEGLLDEPKGSAGGVLPKVTAARTAISKLKRPRGARSSDCLCVHPTDGERETAYERQSSIGKLDKGLDGAKARGGTVVSMKDDWKTILPRAGG